MHAEFWLTRWQAGQIGFHQTRVTPWLPKVWPTLDVPVGSRVLVPLCGKSLDMLWLAQQGYQVLGVELSPLAVEQFFAENGLQPEISVCTIGQRYRAGAIDILCGDIFAMDAQTLASCAAAYDRAALVALPADMRASYVRHVYGQLHAHYRALLLTLDYDPAQMDGPPFAVHDDEVQALCHPHSRATLLERRDIRTKDARATEYALTRLDTLVYRLERA